MNFLILVALSMSSILITWCLVRTFLRWKLFGLMNGGTVDDFLTSKLFLNTKNYFIVSDFQQEYKTYQMAKDLSEIDIDECLPTLPQLEDLVKKIISGVAEEVRSKYGIYTANPVPQILHLFINETNDPTLYSYLPEKDTTIPILEIYLNQRNQIVDAFNQSGKVHLSDNFVDRPVVAKIADYYYNHTLPEMVNGFFNE